MIQSLTDYFKKQDEVVAAYLFGSFAKGNARPFSDVDVGIILHHDALSKEVHLRKRYMAELGRTLRKDIHPVILNTADELLLKQVFKQGVCVCDNDSKQRMQFRMVRFAMISEFGYYLSLTQRGFQRKSLRKLQVG